jgi:hypothetical protein
MNMPRKPSLTGTYRLVNSKSIEKGDTTNTTPAKGTETIKILNDGHFAFFTHDLNKGAGPKPVYDSGSGAYVLDGDRYTEHLEFCNEREWENRTFNFKIEVRHDTIIQQGIEKIDSLKINHEIVETYVRLKE